MELFLSERLVGPRVLAGEVLIPSQFRATSGSELARNDPIALREVRSHADTLGMAVLQTSILEGSLRGKVGNAVFVRSPFGVQVRDHVIPADPQTPAQMAARQRMRVASAAWRLLDASQIQAWNEFAEAITPRASGLPSLPAGAGRREFCKLALKLLQIDPLAAVPLDPPSGVFGGDSIAVTAEAAGRAVRFAASGANAEGVVTELLLQPVPTSITRPFPEKYRTQGFVAFGPDFVAPVPGPGWYAAACRFVRVSTGQASGILLAGTVRVV